MKRFFKVTIAVIMLMFVSLSFFACDLDKDDRFYEHTNEVYSDFVQNVCLNNEYNNGIKYGANVSYVFEKINNNEYTGDGFGVYTELKTVYDNIFTSSFYFLSSFEGIFLVVPATMTTQMKSDYQKFEEKLTKVKADIQTFKTNVDTLDEHLIVNTKEYAIGSISLQHLREYKRKLITLCEEIVDLDNNFLKLCNDHIYKRYDNFKNEDESYIELSKVQIKNQKTIINLQSVIDTITPAIKYLNAFNGDYVKLESDNIFDILKSYTQLNNTVENSATLQELQNYIEINNAYQNDKQCFYTSLDNINMTEFRLDYNFNLDEYAKEDANRYAYVNKIYSFTSSCVNALYQANKTLCEVEE